MQKALGLIETVGLTTALTAADAAVKAAAVRLVGYELTRGGGMVTVKVQGDVGAVKAAVAAGADAARKVGRVSHTYVIPRPHQGVTGMAEATEGAKGSAVEGVTPQAVEVPAPVAGTASAGESPPTGASEKEPIPPWREGGDEPPPAVTCNLCGDPLCLRKKGDSKSLCIHFDKHEKGADA